MTQLNNIESERERLNKKLLLLETIETASRELEALRNDSTDTLEKELNIHLLWENYNEL